MCNVANVQPGDTVLDPFCGTGSILVASTHLGAYSFGGEIEPTLIHGGRLGLLNKNSSYYKKDLTKPYIIHNF
jgi:tRNA G10  N-methylase Trm11